MKAIRFNGEITSISAKKDRSVGMRLNTPELSSAEKAELMDLQGINIDVFIKPLDRVPDDISTIDKDLNAKSSSQRLRAVLFILWKQLKDADVLKIKGPLRSAKVRKAYQDGEVADFNTYYKVTMEKIINHFKEKLED